MNNEDNDNSIYNIQLRQRIKYLEKQLDKQNKTMYKICNKLNIKFRY